MAERRKHKKRVQVTPPGRRPWGGGGGGCSGTWSWGHQPPGGWGVGASADQVGTRLASSLSRAAINKHQRVCLGGFTDWWYSPTISTPTPLLGALQMCPDALVCAAIRWNTCTSSCTLVRVCQPRCITSHQLWPEEVTSLT